jgi:phosphoribosylglycinamide formyltransferase-1
VNAAGASSSNPLRIAVFASGEGSNLCALAEAIERGELDARIVAVVTNNSKCGAVSVAHDAGLTAYHVSSKTHADPGAAMYKVLKKHEVELIALAGYLKKLDARIVAAFEGRAINIHPAPLPRFGGKGMYGEAAIAAVMRTGAHSTGVTIHRVTEEYDEGEQLSFRPVPIDPKDSVESLAARVREVEHDLYWRVIQSMIPELRK